MRILTRYILREHLGPFFFAVMSLTVLLLLNEVTKRFEKLVGKGLHWTLIAEVFVQSIPFILAQTLPMAVLIAVLFVFNRMEADKELTAIRAGGIPLPRTLLPVLGAATLLAGGMVWFNNTILPESNHRLSVLLTSIGQKMPTFELREQTINEVLPSQLYLQAGRIHRKRSVLEDVAIYDERLPNRSRTIYADSGHVAYNQSQTDLYLTLHSGEMQELMTNKPESFQRMHFHRLVMVVKGVTNELEDEDGEGWRSDREMTIGQMKEEVRRARDRERRNLDESRAYAIGVTRIYAEGLGEGRETLELAPDSILTESIVRSLRREQTPWAAASRFHSYAMEASTARAAANRYAVEIQKKFSIPAACIVFVLLGAPIAIRYPLGGVALVVAVSLGVFSAYYISLVGGEELADRLILSPFWAMWSSNVLFGGTGLLLVWRSRRAGRG